MATSEASQASSAAAGGSLGIRAYARHRGTSAPSVLRAIRSRRLVKSIGLDAKGKPRILDVQLADQEWAANTDLSRAPGYVKERAAAQAVTPVPVTPVKTVTRRVSDFDSLADASAREKHWKAKQAELEYLKDAGELIEVSKVEGEIVDTFTLCKTRLLGLPSKAKHALPHLTHADVRVLDELVRQALADLAAPELRKEPDA